MAQRVPIRQNLFGLGSKSKHYTRSGGGKFKDVSDYGSVAEAKRESATEYRKTLAAERRAEKAAERKAIREERAAERKAVAKERLEAQRERAAEREKERMARAYRKRIEKKERQEAAKAKKSETRSPYLSAPDEKTIQEGFKRGLSLNEILRGNPSLFDRCVKDVKARGAAKNAYAVCKSALKKNPAQESAEAFEEFHGYAPTELVKVTQKVHRHRFVAAAGDLVGLQVRPISGGRDLRNEDLGDAMLTFNEKENQLFITGGKQYMSPADLRRFGIREDHELHTLGKLVKVGYFTDKKHLGKEGGEAVYDHTFRTTNENGRHVTVKIARYPDLIYRVLDQQFEISGGSYTIRAEGIDR